MTTKSIFVSSLLAITTVTGLGHGHASADTVSVDGSYVMPGMTTPTMTDPMDPTDPTVSEPDPTSDTDVYGFWPTKAEVKFGLCKTAAAAELAACDLVPLAATFIATWAGGPIGGAVLELTGLTADLIRSCSDLYDAEIVACWLSYNGTRGPGK